MYTNIFTQKKTKTKAFAAIRSAPLIEAYTHQEQEELIRVLDLDSRPGYSAIALMIETGLRVGEVLALRWCDVQLDRKRIYIRATVVRLANKKQSFVQDSAKTEYHNVRS